MKKIQARCIVTWLSAIGLAALSPPAGAVTFEQFTFATSDHDNGIGMPAWSPDGRALAVTSWTVDDFFPYEAHVWIWLLGVDGSAGFDFPNQHLPGTWHGPMNLDPSWSPAGNRIVFSGFGGLWIGGVAESLLVSLEVPGREPVWSPDGTRIAYTNWPGIWIVPAAGGSAAPLTAGPDQTPAWSPDGNWIAFSSTRDGQSDLWIVAATGGELRRITDDPAVDTHPSWSPDGELIVFSSDRSGNPDIWVVRPSNGALSQVTDDPAYDGEPAWSPDGTRIAFTSDRSGCQNIWLASDLRTVRVDSMTWSGLKSLYRGATK